MNIKSRPLMIAAGAGIAVQIVLTVLSTAASFLATPSAMIDPMAPNAMPNMGLMGGLAFVGVAVCCLMLLVDAGVGALYAWQHNKEEAITLQDGIIGGAAAGGAARIVSSVIGVIISLLMTPLLMDRMADQFGPEMMSPGIGSNMMGVSLVGGAVGGVFNICFALVIGLALGAAGGGILAAISERQNKVV